MTSEGYLAAVLNKYALPRDHVRQVELAAADLYEFVRRWAGTRLGKVEYSGSFAKATTIRGGTDVDLFNSLKPSTQASLRDIHNGLYTTLSRNGLRLATQNVSIGLTHRGLKMDLVPARKYRGPTQDHSLYRNRAGSWTKTNVARHIQIVRDSGRNEEIRALKIWRRLHGLDFPSIYLELVAIRALRRRRRGNLAANLICVFEWLEAEIRGAAIADPANTANVISDDVTSNEKRAASRAAWSLQQPYWDRILW